MKQSHWFLKKYLKFLNSTLRFLEPFPIGILQEFYGQLFWVLENVDIRQQTRGDQNSCRKKADDHGIL